MSNEDELIQVPFSNKMCLKSFNDIPTTKFCGYITPEGYVALKHYTNKARFKEISKADGLIINVFYAKGIRDAQRKLRDILQIAFTELDHEVLYHERMRGLIKAHIEELEKDDKDDSNAPMDRNDDLKKNEKVTSQWCAVGSR